MESVAIEVASFGIRSMLVEPGFFRTELLTPESTQYAEASIADYAERTVATVASWKSMDDSKAATPQNSPPPWSSSRDTTSLARFPGGADAVTTFEDRAKLLLELADANRASSSNLDHDQY